MKRNQTQPELQKKQKLQQMFKKIQTITIQVIQYLNGLYQQNNLIYCANQYYSTLIRLFSPFQLLNVYKIDKDMLYKTNHNVNLNYQNKTNQNMNQHVKSHVKPNGITNANIFHDTKIPNYILPRSSYQLNTSQQKQIYTDNRRGKINHQQPQMQNYRYRLPQDIYNQHQPSISQQNLRKDQQNNKNLYRKGRPRILTQQQQMKLCNWIRQYTRNGKQITRFAIAQKAKQVASYQEFQASQSWLDRFLKRYSDIKGMIKIPNNMKNLKNTLISAVAIETKKHIPKETNIKKNIERKIKQKVKKQIQQSESPKFYEQPFESLEDYQRNLIFQEIVSDNQKIKEEEQQKQNSPIQDQNQSKNSKKSIQNQQKQQNSIENTKKQQKQSQKGEKIQKNQKSKKLV